MQHENSLPPDTRTLLRRLIQRDDLEGFTLIGGTALALRHGHRISEDLDLAWTAGDLPTDTIRRIIAELPQRGPAQNLIDPLDRELAENDGLYLAGHQQDWEIDGVKVTFYAQPDRNSRILEEGQTELLGKLRVATDDTLFKLKSVVLLDRTASRDLFDLWWFHEHQGRTVEQILANMRAHDPHLSVDIHLAKLAPSKLSEGDPGFETTLCGAPQTKIELLERMRVLADSFRSELSRRAAIQSQKSRPGMGR
ncbi:nucleotidyl transferase AbiEii/AbiGii toxin family protein [Novosphingobium sp. G106]|uniref:nucleotidyl transferase AbiEii/AbiGii toxin family protein n=1 Tax=Novosphingobium sp. G106 TaxID=2849500 RepID=UPI001C2D3F73|nr:nucleotidyl transferase AbiEii/AbiGii toxin family protein [Novosphingobium sp. G106]MBV1692084.1 nucleotidyl transferase AbiEii/AbiGii toxin family protein [Novosphingobium sp. G106]